jgi:hypothetical protein
MAEKTLYSDKELAIASASPSNGSEVGLSELQEGEVFAAGEDGVEFRTVGWVRAAMFLLKMTFSAGVLSIPAALYTLGAVAGALFILFWGVLNTCEPPACRFPCHPAHH